MSKNSCTLPAHHSPSAQRSMFAGFIIIAGLCPSCQTPPKPTPTVLAPPVNAVPKHDPAEHLSIRRLKECFGKIAQPSEKDPVAELLLLYGSPIRNIHSASEPNRYLLRVIPLDVSHRPIPVQADVTIALYRDQEVSQGQPLPDPLRIWQIPKQHIENYWVPSWDLDGYLFRLDGDLQHPGPGRYRFQVRLDYVHHENPITLCRDIPFQETQGKPSATASKIPQNIPPPSSRKENASDPIQQSKQALDEDPTMETRYIPLAYVNVKDIVAFIQQISAIEPARNKPLTETIEPHVLAQLRSRVERMGVAKHRIDEVLREAVSVFSTEKKAVIPDTSRNALLISARPQSLLEILALIEQLDIPLRLVRMNVHIAEIPCDNTGVFETDVAHQLLGDNIIAYIRAMQATKHLEVISRPKVITRDHTKANISLGREIPMNHNKTTHTYAHTHTEDAISGTVIFNKVQTALDITPHIHPGNYITLDMTHAIDEVSTKTLRVSGDFSPQILLRRIENTTVRIKEGQTICLGGYVSDRAIETQKNIPILADLPLVGAWFQYTQRRQVKTELMVFITPQILQAPRDILRQTQTD